MPLFEAVEVARLAPALVRREDTWIVLWGTLLSRAYEKIRLTRAEGVCDGDIRGNGLWHQFSHCTVRLTRKGGHPSAVTSWASGPWSAAGLDATAEESSGSPARLAGRNALAGRGGDMLRPPGLIMTTGERYVRGEACIAGSSRR